MDKKIVKRLIILGIFAVYTIVSMSVFVIAGAVYMSGMKKKAMNENEYSVKIAKDFINDEMNNLTKDANTAARDEYLCIALKYGIKDMKFNEKINNFEIRRVERLTNLDYKNLANYLRNKIFGWTYAGFNERGIEIFDKDIKLLGNSLGFPNEFIDKDNNENMPYFVSSGSSFIENRGDKLYMKGISGVCSDSVSSSGYVLAGKSIDIFFLNRMKKMLNKEIIVVKKENVMLSTVYEGTERVEGIMLGGYKNSINYMKYNELKIGNRKLGISFFPLLTPKNQIIAYVGIGYDTSEIEDVAKKATKRMIPFIALYILISFFIIYFSTVILFRNFESSN